MQSLKDLPKPSWVDHQPEMSKDEILDLLLMMADLANLLTDASWSDEFGKRWYQIVSDIIRGRGAAYREKIIEMRDCIEETRRLIEVISILCGIKAIDAAKQSGVSYETINSIRYCRLRLRYGCIRKVWKWCKNVEKATIETRQEMAEKFVKCQKKKT